MEKVQWNSVNKKQNGLKQSKNDKSSIVPEEENKMRSGHEIKKSGPDGLSRV